MHGGGKILIGVRDNGTIKGCAVDNRSRSFLQDTLRGLQPNLEEPDEVNQLTGTFEKYLAGCLDKDEKGQLKMTFTLPDESTLHALAKSLAKVVNIGLQKPV